MLVINKDPNYLRLKESIRKTGSQLDGIEKDELNKMQKENSD